MQHSISNQHCADYCLRFFLSIYPVLLFRSARPSDSSGDATIVGDSASVLSKAVRAAVRSSSLSSDNALINFCSTPDTSAAAFSDANAKSAPNSSSSRGSTGTGTIELTSDVSVWVLRLWWAIHMHAGAADAKFEHSACSQFSGLRRHAQGLSAPPNFLEAGCKTLMHLVGPVRPPLFEFLFGALVGEFSSIEELQVELELATTMLKPCSAGELVHPW
jgi:hypothetical protein